jgi:hypothetical protein
MSAATAQRVLRSQRTRHPRGLSTTRAGTLLKHHIPIRTFQEWNEVKPGFLEGDLVADCGIQAEGGYLYMLSSHRHRDGLDGMPPPAVSQSGDGAGGLPTCANALSFSDPGSRYGQRRGGPQ